MIAVIIAGGSGTRLWPLSTPEYPKHLLKINGDKRSLVQRTFDRARKLTDKIYVVSEVGHIDHVMSQLPELPKSSFIVEPARRGTANCIVAALSQIAGKHDTDEPIAILPADHYIRDLEGFEHTFRVASETARREKKIVLIGVEPTYPAIAFGYIQKGRILDEESFVFTVETFKEKPNYETARKYVKSGSYLWNCGYFVASLDVFKNNMQEHAPKLLKNLNRLKAVTLAEYNDLYLSFESDSIDYALIELVDDLLVVPANFDWMDLGSFNDLHSAVTSDEHGNHTTGTHVEMSEVENSFVQNHEDKPMAVVGLDNVVIINTEKGILIARKDLSQKIGEVSKKLNQDLLK